MARRLLIIERSSDHEEQLISRAAIRRAADRKKRSGGAELDDSKVRALGPKEQKRWARREKMRSWVDKLRDALKGKKSKTASKPSGKTPLTYKGDWYSPRKPTGNGDTTTTRYPEGAFDKTHIRTEEADLTEPMLPRASIRRFNKREVARQQNKKKGIRVTSDARTQTATPQMVAALRKREGRVQSALDKIQSFRAKSKRSLSERPLPKEQSFNPKGKAPARKTGKSPGEPRTQLSRRAFVDKLSKLDATRRVPERSLKRQAELLKNPEAPPPKRKPLPRGGTPHITADSPKKSDSRTKNSRMR